MPDIGEERYRKAMQLDTCVVCERARPSWASIGLYRWVRCRDCTAPHCAEHGTGEETVDLLGHRVWGFLFGLRLEWRCRYCGELNEIIKDAPSAY